MAAKTSEAKVAEGPEWRPSEYAARARQLGIAPDADAAEIIHEYFHHIDFQTVSVDRSAAIGQAIHDEIQRFGILGESGRKALVLKIHGDINLEDMFDAISLSEIGRGHGRDYWIENTGSRYREVFANLGSMFHPGDGDESKAFCPNWQQRLKNGSTK